MLSPSYDRLRGQPTRSRDSSITGLYVSRRTATFRRGSRPRLASLAAAHLILAKPSPVDDNHVQLDGLDRDGLLGGRPQKRFELIGCQTQRVALLQTTSPPSMPRIDEPEASDSPEPHRIESPSRDPHRYGSPEQQDSQRRMGRARPVRGPPDQEFYGWDPYKSFSSSPDKPGTCSSRRPCGAGLVADWEALSRHTALPIHWQAAHFQRRVRGTAIPMVVTGRPHDVTDKPATGDRHPQTPARIYPDAARPASSRPLSGGRRPP